MKNSLFIAFQQEKTMPHSCLSHVMRKPVYAYVNNKGADQPANLHSLISTFVVRCLDRLIPLLAISEISSLLLVCVAEQLGLSFTGLKTGFVVTSLIL